MFLNSLFVGFRTRAGMQAEIIALRHQLIVLQRTQKPKRVVLKPGDRCIWVWRSRVWSSWRSALIIVKPQTVIGWRQTDFSEPRCDVCRGCFLHRQQLGHLTKFPPRELELSVLNSTTRPGLLRRYKNS